MKYASEAFNLAIAALIAALLLIAPAVAGECSPDKSQITVGLAAGHPYGGPQAVTFCRDEKAAITRYRINQVAGFAGCELVEFIHFRLECGGERIGHEDAGVRLGRGHFVAFTRDGKIGPDWKRAYNLAEAVARQ